MAAHLSRVIVLSTGEFSGVRKSLTEALRAHVDDVVEVPHSLRFLRFRWVYGLLIYVSALLAYGRTYRRYLHRTYMSQWARGRANCVATDSHADVDAVICLSIQPNRGTARDGRRYAIFTDHVNRLSKRAPDFGLNLPERNVSLAWNRCEAEILGAQDKIFVTSRYAARGMVELYGIDPAKILVVGAGPNADVDCERDGVIKNYHERSVLFVGLDPERKGLPDLIEAIHITRETFPDVRLDVVGVEGQSSANVHYHGKVSGDPLKQMFYAAQVFVMPTLREPFGIVFLEAMWSKAVCVGTDLFAIPEMIRDGVTGFLVPPRDPPSIATRLIELFSNPDQLERMAEAAYRDAREKWAWNQVAARMVAALEACPPQSAEAASLPPLT